MDIKFNVKQKYVVNGKEYNSIEEMPAAIREIYEKAVANAKGIEHGIISSEKIVFNGQEYESVDLMPSDVRQVYETLMKTVKSGEFSVKGNAGFTMGEKAESFKNKGILGSYSMTKPIAPKSFFSSRVFIIAAAILALLVGIYFLISIGSFR